MEVETYFFSAKKALVPEELAESILKFIRTELEVIEEAKQVKEDSVSPSPEKEATRTKPA